MEWEFLWWCARLAPWLPGRVPEQPGGSRALNYKRVILQGTVGREPSHCRLWQRRYWCRGDEA